MHRLPATILSLTIVSCLGCGSGNPWEPVQVTGTITYDDGSPIPVESMKLYFSPQTPPIDSKTFPREGAVGVNVADGSFEKVTTYKYADGLIPGKHKVMVVAYGGGGGGRGGDLSPKVPKEYTQFATTPIEIDTADSPVHIKIRKP